MCTAGAAACDCQSCSLDGSVMTSQTPPPPNIGLGTTLEMGKHDSPADCTRRTKHGVQAMLSQLTTGKSGALPSRHTPLTANDSDLQQHLAAAER